MKFNSLFGVIVCSILLASCGGGSGEGSVADDGGKKETKVPQSVTNAVVKGDMAYFAVVNEQGSKLQRLNLSQLAQPLEAAEDYKQFDGKIISQLSLVNDNALAVKYVGGDFSVIKDISKPNEILDFNNKFTFDATGIQARQEFVCEKWQDYFRVGDIQLHGNNIWADFSYIDDNDNRYRFGQEKDVSGSVAISVARASECNPGGEIWTGYHFSLNERFMLKSYDFQTGVEQKTSTVVSLTDIQPSFKKNRYNIVMPAGNGVNYYLDSSQVKGEGSAKLPAKFEIMKFDFNGEQELLDVGAGKAFAALAEIKMPVDLALTRAVALGDSKFLIVNNSTEAVMHAFDLLFVDLGNIDKVKAESIALGNLGVDQALYHAGNIYLLGENSLLHILVKDAAGAVVIDATNYKLATVGLNYDFNPNGLFTHGGRVYVGGNLRDQGGQIKAVNIKLANYLLDSREVPNCNLAVTTLVDGTSSKENCLAPSNRVFEFKTLFSAVNTLPDLEIMEIVTLSRRLTGVWMDYDEWMADIRPIIVEGNEEKFKQEIKDEIINKDRVWEMFGWGFEDAYISQDEREAAYAKWKEKITAKFLDVDNPQARALENFRQGVRSALTTATGLWGFYFNDAVPATYPVIMKKSEELLGRFNAVIESLDQDDIAYLGQKNIDAAKKMLKRKQQ